MDKLGLQLPVQVEIRTSLTAIVYVHRIIFIHKKGSIQHLRSGVL